MLFENLLTALDPRLFFEYRNLLLSGLIFNFYVFFAAAIVAVTFGLFASLFRLSRLGPLRAAGTFYAELCRNTPEYIFLVWVHYVPPILLSLILNTNVSFSPYFSAVIALGLSSSGYFTETFRTGILSIPKGHVEAAHSLGMSSMLTLRRIILPQAVRKLLPEAMNQFVSLFKGTTLVSLIAVPDMLYQVSMVTQQEMRPLPLYSSAAIVFFVVIFAMSSIVRKISARWRMVDQ